MQVKIIDRFGGVASALCVLHCLLVSLAPSILSTLDVGDSFQEIFEWSFFSLAILFALVSASLGFRMLKKLWLLGLFGGGIAILGLGRMSEALHLFEGGDILSILGGLTLFGAHILSTRCCK